jgi:hypothetical protein
LLKGLKKSTGYKEPKMEGGKKSVPDVPDIPCVPGVFISYARTDLISAQKLEELFQAEGFRVWRYQPGIVPGEQWPKAIGRAIEKGKIFLLLWSQQAAESPVVDLEWNTALALQKTIVPVFLDNTPLPAALKSFAGVFLEEKDPALTVKKILDMTAKLAPAQTLPTPLPVESRPGAAHDKTSPKWWENWQARVAFFVILLTLLTFVLDIPEKAINFYQAIFGKPLVTCTLKGVVLDVRQMPIGGVEIMVDKLPGLSVKSTGTGSFLFEKVPGDVGDRVRVTARCPGYKVWDEYVTLPGPKRIILEDQ